MNKPNYYSVLPANIRYNKSLTDKAKLLYSEITSLCNFTGECYANNEYFERLYDLSESTISRIIKQLKKCGFIDIRYIYKNGTKEIEKRVISIPDNTHKEVVSEMTVGGVRNDKDNNIKKYNIPKGILYKEKSKKRPSLDEIVEYAKLRNLTHVDCDYFYNYFNDSNWIDSKGREVHSWKQKILTWEKREKKKEEIKNGFSTYPRL